MKATLKGRCDRFIENRDVVRSCFAMESTYLYPICAAVITDHDMRADPERLKRCKELLKEQQAHPVIVTASNPGGGAAAPMVPVMATPQESSDHIKQNLRDKYPQAEYDELLLIAKAWKDIAKRELKLVRRYYQIASLTPGNEAGTLELGIADIHENDLAISYFSKPDKLQEIADTLTQMAQCQVKLKFRRLEGQEQVHELQKDWDLSRIVFDDIEMHE